MGLKEEELWSVYCVSKSGICLHIVTAVLYVIVCYIKHVITETDFINFRCLAV